MAEFSETVVVLNPVSGGGAATPTIREHAHHRGFEILETEAEGDGATLARRAVASGADRVVAAGGDGTVNEVVQGLSDADALDEVTVGVVPGGTGNSLAGNLGIESVERAFELLDGGPVRRIDLATDGERVFLNSCVAGLTAEASEGTDPELKRRWGVLAYVITTLRTFQDFQPLPLDVEARAAADDVADSAADDVADSPAATDVAGADAPSDAPADGSTDSGSDAAGAAVQGEELRWAGEAALVLVGNARRFQVAGRSQADVEDGLLEVLIVEQPPSADLLDGDTLGRLFGEGFEGFRRLRTPALDVSVRGDDPVAFSFDGEIEERTDLSLAVRPRAVAIHVGPDYEPDPDAAADPDSLFE